MPVPHYIHTNIIHSFHTNISHPLTSQLAATNNSTYHCIGDLRDGYTVDGPQLPVQALQRFERAHDVIFGEATVP